MKDKEIIKCDECDLPVAAIVGQSVVIRSRHRGRKHTTVIPLEELVRRILAAADEKTSLDK